MVAGGVVALMAILAFAMVEPFGNAKKGAKRWLFFLLHKKFRIFSITNFYKERKKEYHEKSNDYRGYYLYSSTWRCIRI